MENQQPAKKIQLREGGWGWYVVAGSFLAHFLLVGCGRSSGVLYIVWLERFSGSTAATAWIHGLHNASMMMLGPVSSFLSRRFGCRPVVMVGGICISSSYMLSSFAPSLTFLYFSYSLLGGMSASLVFTPILIIIGQWFDKKKGKAMGLASMGSGLGSLVIAPVTQYMLTFGGYFFAMILLSGLLLHETVAGSLLRPPPPSMLHSLEVAIQKQEMKYSDGEHPHPEPGHDQEIEMIETKLEDTNDSINSVGKCQTDRENKLSDHNPRIRRSWQCMRGTCREFSVLRHPVFLLYCVNLCTMPYSVIFYLVFLPSLAHELGFDKQSGALLLSVAGGADVAGRLLWGSIFDLRPLRPHRRFMHSLLGAILGALTMLTGLVPPSYSLLAAVVLTWGVFQAGYHGQRVTVISQYVTAKEQSKAVGVLSLFQGLGNLSGPLLLGLVHDYFATYRACFLTGGGLFCFTSCILSLQYICSKMAQRRAMQPH